MGVGLDGEELRAERQDFGLGEAGAEEAVEAAGRGRGVCGWRGIQVRGGGCGAGGIGSGVGEEGLEEQVGW